MTSFLHEKEVVLDRENNKNLEQYMETRKIIKESAMEDVNESEAEKITDRIMENLSEAEKIRNGELPKKSAREFLKELKQEDSADE